MKFLLGFFTVLAESKKAKALFVALLVMAASKVPYVSSVVDTELVLGIVGILGVYILGQGWADTGKEAVKLELESRAVESAKAQAVVEKMFKNEAPLPSANNPDLN